MLASPATPFLTTIQEGETTSSGDSVGTLLGTLVSDADGHVCGMAIYAQDSTSGVWECVLGKNLPWVPVGTVSPTMARLLAPTARVRFVPADGYTGIVSNGLSFRAWDRSSGTNGGVASLAVNGGSTPFSAGSGSAGIKVSKINHAPLFSHVAALTLPPILENQFRSPGTNVSRILGSYVSDADGDECGIAVSTVNSASGVWEYSNDRGRSWLQLELPRGLYSRLLGPDVYLRFVPDRDFVGTITNGLLVRAWDQTRGTDGGLATTFETGGQTPFSRAEVWISQTVKEANRIPTDILISATTVLENQPVGTPVAQLSALDPNVSDTHTFAFVAGEGDEGNASFTISSNALLTGAVFDRETRSEYPIRIRARDNLGGLLTKVFTVTIGDVPDMSPHEVTLDPVRVRENEAAGTVVGQLTALDVDLDETHVFSLVAGEGDTDNGSFAIQGNALVTTAPIDYETKPVCQIRVQADDGQNPPLARTFNIWVVNVEDNVPPQDLRLNSTCLLDETPPNTAVARIGVLDPNPADTQTLSLVAGPGDADNGTFQIEGRILLTATSIDFDQRAKYQVRIQTDDGQGGLLEKAFEIVPASLLWREDFEQGLGEWTHTAEVGSDTWQLIEGVHGSPTHSLSAAGTADTSDASAMSPWIAIPATAEQLRLEFQQQYEWDFPGSDPLDGGVLEYRRQGEGEAWDDLLRGEAGHSVVAGGYPVAISVTHAHPFSGRGFWSGSTSNRFVPAVVSLDAGPLAGQTVQFRWRQIATSGVTSGGWHLDDISLAAVAPPDPSVVRVQELVWVGSRLQLTWTSLPGQTYVIEATTSLGSAWAPVMDPIPGQPGATRTTVTLDPAALPGHPQGVMFFRMHSP